MWLSLYLIIVLTLCRHERRPMSLLMVLARERRGLRSERGSGREREWNPYSHTTTPSTRPACSVVSSLLLYCQVPSRSFSLLQCVFVAEEEQQLDQTNSPFGMSLHKNARGRGRGRGARGGRGGRGRGAGSGEGAGGGRGGGRAHIRSHWEGGAPRPLTFRGK